MHVVGNGFLARHLATIMGSHPDVTVVAAGVSSTRTCSEEAFERDVLMVYETIRRCREQDRLLVYLSTASQDMYRAPDSAGREDEPVYPLSPYGRHKLLLETTVRQSGVRYLVVRLSYVVGPHQPEHQLLPALTRALRSGTVTVYAGACRDLIGVDDVVTIIDRLLRRRVSNEVVNVASGVAVPVERIIDRLELRLGTAARRRYVGDHLPYAVSVEKLRRLVPAVADMGFTGDYHQRIIDRAVAALAQAPR